MCFGMDEQALAMCDKPDLLEYIAKLHVEADDLREHNVKLTEENEDLNKTLKTRKACNEAMYSQVVYESFHEEQMELKNKEIEKLKAEVDKLKHPVIYNRDMRCSQLDIRVGYSYISECIEGVLPALECDEMDVSALPDVVYQEVAKTIDSAINSFILSRRNLRSDIDEYIYDVVYEEVEKLKEQGLVKEEE